MPPHHAGSKKRRREPINVNTKLVEIYEDLASENDEIRLKAAQALVSQFTPDKTPTDEEVQKTLSRLFKGLCSSRKAARIGFSIALTEVLAQVFGKREAPLGVDVNGVLGVWENVSNATGGESGQEARDHYFGRLFGAEAIIKSSILFSPKALLPEWTKVLELVFDLAKKKPWIREECGWIIFRCIQEIAAQKADSKLVETALQLLVSNDLARTPEGVAIWLAARDLFPGINFPAKVWKHDDPLDSKERSQLTKAMKESSSGEAEGEGEKGAKASGVWNSKLHFAWDAVMGSLNKEKESKKGSRLGFADFWTEVVDNGLFASASSEERKYWGFLLFIKAMNEHSPEVASQSFTKNLVRCLTNQLAVEDRYLHRMALKAAKAIQARVSKEPEFAAPAVKGLMGSAGVVNFDQMTKTKTVEKIVSEANIDALETILPLFESLVASPGTTDGKAAAANRQVLAGLLLSMVRAHATDDGSEVALERILFILARFAYFTSEDGKVGSQPAFSEQSQELFRSRINSCLNSIIAGQKHAATLPYAVVRKIRDAAKSEEYGKFIIKMDDTLKESVKGAFKALKKLSSSESPAPGTDAFKLLYSMTILQVYNGDADAASMLDELDFCYNKIFASDKKSKKKAEKAEETSEASDALVEILLSFASKPSQLFRRMSEQVFTAFAPSVTATGLESLISILEAKESLAGQQEMFDQQDDEEDIGEDDEDEEGDSDSDMMDVDEEDSDVEIVNPDDDNEQGSDNEAEEDEEEESSTEEDAAEIAAFEAKLASALGTHRADKDLQAEESSSDEDMSDSEMDAIDTQLVKVFRARRDALSKKSDKKDAKENMVNFKNRVLDLLEIYVKKKECHSSILCLDLILPLLRLTRRSTVKQISARANNVLREYTKLCKGPSLPSLSDGEKIESVWSLLKDVHEEAKRSGPPTHASGASQASLLLVKVLTAHDRAFVGGVVDVYGETRKSQLLDKKCHVQPAFFTDWSNWCVSAGKAMKE